jgi:hypothetical protein
VFLDLKFIEEILKFTVATMDVADGNEPTFHEPRREGFMELTEFD